MDRRTFIQTSTLTAAAMVTTSAARSSRPGRIPREEIEMRKVALVTRASKGIGAGQTLRCR